MVNNFIETEDRNFGMFRYIQVRGQQREAVAGGSFIGPTLTHHVSRHQHVNKEVRRLQKSVDSTQKEIAAYKAKHSSVIESKEKMVVKLRRVAAEYGHDVHTVPQCPTLTPV